LVSGRMVRRGRPGVLQKYREPKSGAFTEATFDGNLAAHQCAETFGDDQPSPVPLPTEERRGVDLTGVLNRPRFCLLAGRSRCRAR
jgi:hypothetical protein